MQITHQEARGLIQFESDRRLDPDQKATLTVHLEDCVECSAYADEIKEMELVLLQVTKRHWVRKPIPLSVDTLRVKRQSMTQTSVILATRTALAGVILLGFVFSAWQFIASGAQPPGQLPANMLPAPTPSIQTTSTNRAWDGCEMRRYTVQRDDTLTSIARQFSVSETEIIEINHLKSESVRMSMELVVPTCNLTPTGTAAGPSLFMTTFTPLTSPTMATPGG